MASWKTQINSKSMSHCLRVNHCQWHKKNGDEVFSGSFCLSGNGYYRAEKVGDNSYANEITKTAKKFKMNLSPLQVRLNFIVKVLFSTAIFLVILEIIRNPNGFSDLDFVRKYPL